MPGTKPHGPYEVWIKKESTPFTFEEWTAASDSIRVLGIPEMGPGIRERRFVNVSRPDRGRFHQVSGRFQDVPFSIPIPLFGSGTAGTNVDARGALFEAAGCSETVVGGTSVTYESDSANPSTTISAYMVDRSQVKGEYIVGGIVQEVAGAFTKDAEPMLTFTGIASRKWEFFKTTLAAEIAAVDTLSMTLTDDCVRSGEISATSLTNLSIYVEIESEIVKITAFNPTTKVATIARAQFGTAAATHANSLDVLPVKQTPTYEAGLLMGEMDWSGSDGSAMDMRSFNFSMATGRSFDELECSDTASAGVKNGPVEVSGSLTGLYKVGKAVYASLMDQNANKDVAITVGATAGSIFTFNFDALQLTSKSTTRAFDDVEEVSFDWVALDTATAMRGQFQLAET